MILKPKSIIVGVISGIVISAVLILTLAAYVIYTEVKAKELNLTYDELLQKVNARYYSKYVEVSKLSAKIGGTGALKGKPIIEGCLANKGSRDVADLLLKVKFLDKDGAVIYEVIFHPQEPVFGTSSLTTAPIPYLLSQDKIILKKGELLPFKKILGNCPKEIMRALKGDSEFSKTGRGRWAGKFDAEVLFIGF